MALTRLGPNAGVLGGEVSDTDNAYKNWSVVSANATLNLASGKNYFLSGAITINDNITWTISGSGTLTII